MNRLPTTLTAGLTIEDCFEFAGYPSSEWSLVLHMRGPVALNIPLQAAPQGNGHVLAVSAEDSAAWQGGLYAYSLRANQGATVREVAHGTLEIVPDMSATSAAMDARSHAQRTLDAIEAVIEKRATVDQQRYTINNRELWRTPIPELLQLRNTYRAEVRRERRRQLGLTSWGRVIKHVF